MIRFHVAGVLGAALCFAALGCNFEVPGTIVPDTSLTSDSARGGVKGKPTLSPAPTAQPTIPPQISPITTPSATPIPPTSTPVPSVTSVTVSPSSVSLGVGATFNSFSATVVTSGSLSTAVTWSIQEASNCGSITQSGSYTAPAGAAICHISAASVADSSKKGSATVTVTAPTPTAPPAVSPGASPAPDSPTANALGINLGGTSDYMAERLYADVIRMSRDFKAGGDANSSTLATIDAVGWPTQDFSFYVWHGIDQMHGTYALSFKGQATVSSNVGNISVAYDPGSNVSSGAVQITNSGSFYLTLAFSNTKRSATSAVGSGVTDIKLMRPLSPGSTQTFPATELFNTAPKAELAKFKVIRFMDFLGTNWSQQTNWSDRPLPSWPSSQRNPGNTYGWQGIGGPLEHIVRLSNELGTDAWINIPARATDDYVRKVAQLFAFGSDGVNPYTTPQANPVYPPLNSNLKIYVEYSNEVWNFSFAQAAHNCKLASDELVSTAGNSPLNFDKTWNGVAWSEGGNNSSFDYGKCWRRVAKRGLELSNIFRSVFGDQAMMTRIRPIFMTQQADGQGTFGHATAMLFGYYANGLGNFVTTPRPPSYYFYGAGGSGYYNPAIDVSTLDAFFADPGMNPVGWAPSLKTDAQYVAALGLKRVCYEGGPSLDKTGGVRDAISAQAVNDPRMTTAVKNMHNAWSSFGGDLFVYFTAASDYQWGFTDNIYNLATPKLLAIDQLRAATRAPITFGTAIPGNAAGNSPDICSRGWGCSPIQAWDYFTADGSKISWASYSFRADSTGARTVSLSVTNAVGAQVAVFVDGINIGTQATTGGNITFNAGTLSAGLHGVIVRAVSGTFMVSQVGMN